MGGKMRGGGNLIHLPLERAPSAVKNPAFEKLKAPPDGIAKILAVPPKIISVNSAMKELSRILGQTDPMVYTRLGFPRKVNFSSYPDGIEFYDPRSRRTCPRTPGESIQEVDSWVKSWYFSVFEAGPGLLTGRYIDRTHPDFIDGRRRGSLEHVIKDIHSFERDGLEHFIERIRTP